MKTKHQQIIEYLVALKIGSRLSVRKIAIEFDVSEGTAYRAIKEAETLEYVKTIPKIGTIRTAKVEKKNIDKLTFSEILSIVEGKLLGGTKGIDRELSRFVIGAMTVDAMEKYLSSGALLIVGNREEAQLLALERECAVLITGGFQCSNQIKALADEKCLPIISSEYDTFTIATLINRAIAQRMAKKDILLVEDIMVSNPYYIKTIDDTDKWKQLFYTTGKSKFPVLDTKDNVVGIITSKDVEDSAEKNIEDMMTINPITVGPKTTAAYAAHIMVWEEIDLLPVVENKRLVGVVSNQDVLEALQYMQNQPQISGTLEDQLLSGFEIKRTDEAIILTGIVNSIMLSQIGTASWSSMVMLMTTAGIVAVKKYRQSDVSVDSFTVYFIKPVQLDDELEVHAKILEESRNFNKVEITCFHRRKTIARALLSAKNINR